MAQMPFGPPWPERSWRSDESNRRAAAFVYGAARWPEQSEYATAKNVLAPRRPAPGARDEWDQRFRQTGQCSWLSCRPAPDFAGPAGAEGAKTPGLGRGLRRFRGCFRRFLPAVRV